MFAFVEIGIVVVLPQRDVTIKAKIVRGLIEKDSSTYIMGRREDKGRVE